LIVVGPVTCGSADSGAIVLRPVPMRNSITSAPALLLALLIASRNEPAPPSAVVLTTNVENSTRSSTASIIGTEAAAAAAAACFLVRRRLSCFVVDVMRNSPVCWVAGRRGNPRAWRRRAERAAGGGRAESDPSRKTAVQAQPPRGGYTRMDSTVGDGPLRTAAIRDCGRQLSRRGEVYNTTGAGK
jgi:hypothetical protein